MLAVLTEEFTTDPGNKSYSKHARYDRSLLGAKAFLGCKAENPSSPNGGIDGYASVWDVVDRQNEVVRKGAFTKSINERAASGKIPLMVRHYAYGGDVVDAVGVVNTLTEDNYGLKFDASWFADPHSQNIRQKCSEIFGKGIKLGSSIGYRVINYSIIKNDTGKTIVELNELAIGEITISLKPANEAAVVGSAKSEDGKPVLVKLFDKINEADATASYEERSKVVTESLGISVDEAKTLCESLRGSITKTLALLDHETSSTGGTDDASMRNDPKATEANGKTAQSAPSVVSAALNSARHAVESMRMAKMRLDAGHKL